MTWENVFSMSKNGTLIPLGINSLHIVEFLELEKALVSLPKHEYNMFMKIHEPYME